jgi:HEPN domain-containing protein
MLHRPTDETDPKDWFLFAADRLKSADRLWKADGLTMTGIETLQEAVERYLKGYLVAKGWRLEKIHALTKLLEEAIRFDQQFARFRNFATELSADFFAQHYPGGDLTDVGSNYAEFRKQADELVALIKRTLPKYFSEEDQK